MKQRGNSISALLTQMSQAEEVLKTSMNSSGSAMTEHNRTLESAEAKIQQYKASFQELAHNTINSDIIKFFIDLATKTNQAASGISKMAGGSKGLVVEIMAIVAVLPIMFGLLKKIGNISLFQNTIMAVPNTIKGFNKIVEVLTEMRKIDASTDILKISDAMKTLTPAQQLAVLSSKQLTISQRDLILSTSGVVTGEVATTLSTTGLATATTGATVATGGLSAAFKGLGLAMKSAFLSNPVTAILLAITAAVAIAIKVYSNLNVTLKEQQEITENLRAEYREISDGLDTLNETLSTTKTRIDELNALDSLSFIEQSELEKLERQNELLEDQIKLQKLASDAKLKEVQESTVKEFDKDVYVDKLKNNRENVYSQVYGKDTLIITDRMISGEMSPEDSKIYNSQKPKEIDYIKQMTYFLEEMNVKKQQGIKLTIEEQEGYAKFTGELAQFAQKYYDYADKYDNGAGELDGNVDILDENTKAWMDMRNAIYDTIFPAEKATEVFNDMWNDIDFADAKQELLELAEAKELTSKTLDNYLASSVFQVEDNSVAQLIRSMFDYGMSVEDIAKHINSLIIAEENVSEQTSTLTQRMTEYKQALDSIINQTDIATKAISEQVSNGKLSAQTILDLTEAGYGAALAYDDQTGAVILLKDSINNLTTSQIDSLIAELELEKIDIGEKYRKATEDVEAYANGIERINSAKDYELFQQKRQSQIDLGLSTDDIDKQIMALTSQRQSIGDSWNSKSSSSSSSESSSSASDTWKQAFEKEKAQLDYLRDMDVYDEYKYYLELQKLSDKYFKGRNDYLEDYYQYSKEIYTSIKDLQVEALNNEKNKLQEINDEREKQLTLQKAFDNYMNAQTQRKERHWNEGVGWRHETNRDDVTNAKNELESQILDTKIATIEKQINEAKTPINNNYKNPLTGESIKAEHLRLLTQDEISNIYKSSLGSDNILSQVNNTLGADKIVKSLQSINNINTSNNSPSLTMNINKIITDNPKDFVAQAKILFQDFMNDLTMQIDLANMNR